MKLPLFFITALLSISTLSIAAESPFTKVQFNACIAHYLGDFTSGVGCPISLSKMALANIKGLKKIVYSGSKQPGWSKNLGGADTSLPAPQDYKKSYAQPSQQQAPVRYPPITPIEASPQNTAPSNNGGGGITAFQPGNEESSSSSQQPNYLQ